MAAARWPASSRRSRAASGSPARCSAAPRRNPQSGRQGLLGSRRVSARAASAPICPMPARPIQARMRATPASVALTAGGDRRPAVRLVEPAARKAGARGDKREQRRVRDLVVAEAAQGGRHLVVTTTGETVERAAPEQPARTGEVRGVDGVLQRAVGIALLGKPGAGAPVQPGVAPRLEAAQLRAQHVGEERVVAVRGPVPVEDRDRHIGVRQRLELRRGVGAAEHGVAERRREPVEDRGSHEELQPLRRQAREHLLPHVLGHVAVVAGEAGRPGLATLIGERQRRQVEPGGPALGPAQQA